MKFCRRISRSFRIAQIQLFCGLSKPLFLFCFLTALLPGLLLASLLGWKALLFPAAVPHLWWRLFLPLWVLFSCALPSFCAAVILSSRRDICMRGLFILVPICTLHLLLSFLWALMLLYRMPPFFCMISAAVCAVSALLSVYRTGRQCPPLGFLLLIGGIWNALLVFLCADF